jgi:putative membrane protein
VPEAESARGKSGNRARDHLANERTYLAWLRTAIGVLALAAAIARFGQLSRPRDAVAVALCGLLGTAVLVVGTVRYYQVARDLEREVFVPTLRAPLLISLVVLAVATAVLILLV